MDANLQRRVQRYGWDKAAPYYERSWKSQLAPGQGALLDLVSLKAGERVLDVACGTGLLTFKAVALVGPHGEVVGADISEQMIESARTAATAKGAANVRFERMDAEALEFSDSSFDAVLCALGLMYVPDPEKAVREFHRLVRSGGRAAAVVWGQRSKCGWADIFPIVDARVQSDVCPMFFRLGTGEALRQAFLAAGFVDIGERRLQSQLLYATADEACEAAFVGGPVGLAYGRFTDSMKAEAHKEYLASIEPYRVREGYSVPCEFVVVAGTKGGDI